MSKGGGRQSTLDIGKFLNQQIDVKFAGGREVRGILKGFDALVNLVLDECVETIPSQTPGGADTQRRLGLSVCRGSQVMLISPVDGYEQIENPWAQQQGGEGGGGGGDRQME